MDSYRDRARQLAGKSLLVGMSALSAAGSKVARAAAAGVGALTATDREKVTAVRFVSLDGPEGCPALLIAYETGFQVWSLEQASEPTQLVSRRDGPVRLMEVLPGPGKRAGHDGSGQLAGMFPVLALAPGAAPLAPEPPALLRLYSLLSQATVCTLPLSSPALGLAASRQLLVVALTGQLVAYDGLTLEQRFTCVAYMPPVVPPRTASSSVATAAGGSGSPSGNGSAQAAEASSAANPGQPWSAPAVPFALGAAWLAYPSPQPVPTGTSGLAAARLRGAGDRAGHHAKKSTGGMATGGGVNTSTAGGQGTAQSLSGAASDLARAAVQCGGRTLAHAGSASLRYLSGQVAAWRAGGGVGGGSASAAASDGGRSSTAATPTSQQQSAAGTVIVRETAGRRVVAHFRAHGAPLASLAWDGAGTLLATASTSGRSVRLWRVTVDRVDGVGPDNRSGAGPPAPLGSAVCLARLVRGVTPARIQSLSVYSPGDFYSATAAGGGGCGGGSVGGTTVPTGWGAPLAPGIAAMVSVVSGSGTVHVYELPGGVMPASGRHQEIAEQQGTGAVGGTPGGGGSPLVSPAGSTDCLVDGPRFDATARVRRPGLLRGNSVVAAAGGAARALRDPGAAAGGEGAGAGSGASRAPSPASFPAAAVWLARDASLGTRHASSTGCCGLSDGLTLLSAAADGLLLAHACAYGNADGVGLHDRSLGDPSSPGGSDGDGDNSSKQPGINGGNRSGAAIHGTSSHTLGTAVAPSPGLAMVEVARWDVGRRYGWEECEVEMPGSPPTLPIVGSSNELAGISGTGAAPSDQEPSPADRQRWLAEALPAWSSWSEPGLAARASITLVPH